MKKIFTIILAFAATTCLWAQRFQVGDLYYQVCTGEEDVIVDRCDTIGWNIPAEAITVAQACEICAALESGETTGTKYYVMGYVKKIHNKHADGVANYGNAHFYMEDVKGANSQDDFMAYQVYGPDGTKLTDPACVAVGDFVVIYGELTNYNGTYETVGRGTAHIWKSTNPLITNNGGNNNGGDEGGEIPNLGDVTGAGTYDNPYTATDVVAMANSIAGNYYVKAYIVGQVNGMNMDALQLSAPWGTSEGKTYNTDIVIAASADETNAAMMVPVQLPSGALRNGLNLPENPDVYGKEILIYGSLEKYFGVAGIKSPTYAVVDGKEYGTKPVETTGEEVLNETLGTQASFDKFTAVSVSGEQVWSYDASRKCAKMSGYANAATIPNEDWFISPAMDLSCVSAATLIFNHEFGPASVVPNTDETKAQYTVWVSNDFNGDVKTATWTELKGIVYGTEGWGWVSSGDIAIPSANLKANCRIAWKYVCKDLSATWDIKEIIVKPVYTNAQKQKPTSATIQNLDDHYVYVTYQTTGSANYNTLRSIDIPKTVEYEGVNYNVIGIGFAAFKHSTLESITIPSSIKIIGEHIFDNCSALTNVVWNVKNHADFDYKPVGSTYEYTSPFYNVRSQITSFIFGNEVEYIPAYLCCDMNNLNKITIPTNVKDIGDYALSGTGHYNDDSNWENDVLYIDNCLIRAKKTLSGDYTIKEGTRLIAASALFLRQELTSVTIPNSVTNIGAHAFEGCSGLTSIISEAITPPTVGSYAFNSVNNQIPVFVPCGAVSAYRAVNSWNEFPDITEHYAQYSIVVNSQNCEMGLAEIEKNTLCGATIYATPNLGYHFVKWSDGNTENPRTLELTQDTSFTAEFAQSFSGKCGDNLYWAYNESDQSISITGSGDMYNYTSDTQPWLLLKEQIKIVTISNTVISIGQSAFAELIRLGDLYLGTKIETIAENAFANCDRLYHIYSYPTYPPFIKQSSFANYNVYLHVPCEYKEDYDLDVVWGNFKYIECLGAETDNTPTDTVIINASSSSVTITWPTEENAETYDIIIKNGDVVFCTLTFNADGQLLNIAFAPARNGRNHTVQYATQTANGLRFTVTGLNEGTHYIYDITAKDKEGDIIQSHSGEFTTKSNVTTDMDNIQSSATSCQKLFRNGQVYILKGGKTYNPFGQEL